MSALTFDVELTVTELAALNAAPVRPDVQAEINLALLSDWACARHGVPERVGLLAAKAVREAAVEKRLLWQPRSLRFCPICRKDPGYVKYKSGPRKGESNLNRPRVLRGVEMAARFIRIEGSVTIGGCVECVDGAAPIIRELLRDVPAELPEPLNPDGRKLKRHARRRCSACGWTGHEGQMGRLPAVFGGHYPGKCPSCGAKNKPFARDEIETLKGYELEVLS